MWTNKSCNVKIKKRVKLLRSKFKRSTQKLSFMLTANDLGVKVDIEDCSPCQKITFAKLFTKTI